MATQLDRTHLEPTLDVPAGPEALYRLAARGANPEGTRVTVGACEVGGAEFVVMAGPCAVESAGQMARAAEAVAAAGARVLRAGVFKPRTSPYAFQGLGLDGLFLAAGVSAGLPLVTEILAVEDIAAVAARAAVLQVGARNMQNYPLLRALGAAGRPVLLKRGLASTIDELLCAAEYVMLHGNPDVVLCERGIRTFEPATRNTLDLSAVALLKRLTHLPVIVDPSHGTGRHALVAPLAKAALAVGADGLMVEVHPAPDEARCDGDQALTCERFDALMRELAACAPVFGRVVHAGPPGDLGRCRRHIDGIDRALAALIRERLAVAVRAGHAKARDGLPVAAPTREHAVIEHVTSLATNPVESELLRGVFRAIIDGTRLAEQRACEAGDGR
jgi:3-deoxy-7-phosphoheptulonate synthase